MELTPIISCSGGSCPAIYQTASGSFVIQGSIVAAEDADVRLAPDEALVEIPAQLIVDLIAGWQRPE